MNSLQKKKLKLKLSIIGMTILLLGVIIYNVIKPSEEEQMITDLSQNAMGFDWRNATDAERNAQRKQWNNISPEMKKKVFQKIARARLKEMREEMAKMTPEERQIKIRDAVKKMRSSRSTSSKDRQKIRERISSTEFKEMMEGVMKFYQTEFTAKERAELDPLLHEWIRQINRYSK